MPTDTELWLRSEQVANGIFNGYGETWYKTGTRIFVLRTKSDPHGQVPVWVHHSWRDDLESAANQPPTYSLRDTITNCLSGAQHVKDCVSGTQDLLGGSLDLSTLYHLARCHRHHDADCWVGTNIRPIDDNGEGYRRSKQHLVEELKDEETEPCTTLMYELQKMEAEGLVEPVGKTRWNLCNNGGEESSENS